MRKQHKKYSKPKKKYDKKRIDEENEIIKKYGLKNKREIWKTESRISEFRNRAKELLVAPEEEKRVFLSRLESLGLIEKNSGLDDILSLNSLNLLERRLQTLLVKKKIAKTVKEARQMIIHKRVIVGNNIINIPSYIVPKNLENGIRLKARKLKPLKSLSEQQENQ